MASALSRFAGTLLLIGFACWLGGCRISAPPDTTLAAGIEAAQQGDLASLLRWLQEGGDPNQRDAAGWTPLLVAAARGHAMLVEVLLHNRFRQADPHLRFAPTEALPIHFAGHSGDVKTAQLLLDATPSDLDEVWLINGHTLLLQAAFYGHVELAQFAVSRGANTAATTVRGLTALDMARQFQNEALITLLTPSAPSPEKKEAYYQSLLTRIREVVPPDQIAAQANADALGESITAALQQAGADPTSIANSIALIQVKMQGVDLNRLAGDLRQPPITVAVTGTNGNNHPDAVADLRLQIVRRLLEQGASPLVHERHPMGVTAIIRAQVFNHLDALRAMQSHLPPKAMADALNERPPVNGLTGLHDAVMRAGTASPDKLEGYLHQIRWSVQAGARSDIPDFSGRTQHQIALEIADPERRRIVLAALTPAPPVAASP